MSTGLTPALHDCLTAIERLTVDGVAPTLAEIGAELGIASKSDVHRRLHLLKDRGFIDMRPRSARSIRILPTKIGPHELHHLSSAELRTTAAHIAGILAHREGGEHAHDTFVRIAKRVSGRPLEERR